MKVETIKELFERLNAESVLPTAIEDGTEIIVSSLSWAAQPVLQGLKKSKFPGSIQVTVTYPDKRVKTATYVFDRWDGENLIKESEDKMKSIHQRPCPTRDSIDGQIVCSGFGMHPGKIACEYLDIDTGICHSAHTNRIWSGEIPAKGPGRVYPTPPESSGFNPFASGCFPEIPNDPLSSVINPETIKRILDLTCEKAQLDVDRSRRRHRRFSLISDGYREETDEERAKQRERRRLWNEREHRENIAAIYRRIAECHELTARILKDQGLEEEAKEAMNNAIADSINSIDVLLKVLEIEKELYVKHEEMFGVDDVELDD